ncbi:MAG: disulfide bond formation protein B [Alicyclobacillus sp.]|nr:disulfide bond formation protein B [Alicyclobacillus sp.]
MNRQAGTVWKWTDRYGLYLAWLVSVIATAVSLLFSEGFGWAPCELCWFQRVFMYPLVFVLGVAVYRHDHGGIRYALPLSATGTLIAAYHVLVQWYPELDVNPGCRVDVPCTADYLNLWGFLTIPLLSLLSFLVITGLLWLTYLAHRRQAKAEGGPPERSRPR